MRGADAQQQGSRWVGATLASVGAGALVWFLWSLGQGRYVDRYCFDRIERPLGEESNGPQFVSPTELRCTFGDGSAITVQDLRPLLWALFMAVALLVVVAAVWTGTRAREAPPGDGPPPLGSRAVLAVTGLGLAFPAVALALLSREYWSAMTGLQRVRHDDVTLLLVTLSAVGAGLCLREAAGTRVRWP